MAMLNNQRVHPHLYLELDLMFLFAPHISLRIAVGCTHGTPPKSHRADGAHRQVLREPDGVQGQGLYDAPHTAHLQDARDHETTIRGWKWGLGLEGINMD